MKVKKLNIVPLNVIKNPDQYSTLIGFDNLTKSEKDEIKDAFSRHTEKLTSISVDYHPECGCEVISSVLLDRFPMTEKIMHKCSQCNKYVLDKISDPIRFYIPATKQSFGLEDFSEMVFTENRQLPLLEKYYEWHQMRLKKKNGEC